MLKQIDTNTTQLPPKTKETLKGALNDPTRSMRALVKGNLFFFMQYFWDTYSDEPFHTNWHIEKICKELEEVAHRVGVRKTKIHDLIINVPPGTTKTATVSIMFPIWCWVNWYWMKFIATSHSDKLALESAEYSREIVRSEKFQAMFPEIGIKDDKDTKSNFRVIEKSIRHIGRAPSYKIGGGRLSTSVGARITGFHAHIIIPDDIIDPRRALSEVGIKEANNYLDQTLSTRKVDANVTTMVMIMQRLHQDDPTGHILNKKKENIRHICLPGEIINNYKQFVKPQEWIKHYTKDGLLDPIRKGWKVLEEHEADLGQYGYAGQIGQNPTPPGGGMFKVDRMPIIDHLSSETNIVRTVWYWDKAGSTNAGAYTAGVKMSIMRDGRCIVQNVVRGQWAAEDREAILKSNADAEHLPHHIYIEQEPGSGGKESAEATIRNLAGHAVYADRPTGDKTYRADPFSVQVNLGNVVLIKGDWNVKYKEELALFPNGTYKDQVDASSGAFNKLSGKRQVRVLGNRRR